MKLVSRLIISSIFASIIALPHVVCGQTAPDPKLPDYTVWEKVDSGMISVVINGRDTQLRGDVQLRGEEYNNIDSVNLKRGAVELIYNEAGDPWIAVYLEEIGERHPDGSITTKEAHFYMFENVSGQWVFVRDLSKVNMQEFVDFLKTKFGLEIK